MRILEIIPQLSSGGAERFTVDLCNELSKTNEVMLLTFYPLNEYGFYSSELTSSVTLLSLDKPQGLSLRTFKKVLSVIKNFKPDVVHIHLRAIVYCLPALLIYNKVKYFMTIHSAADKEADGYWGFLMRKICFKAGIVKPITISNESHNSFIKYYKVNADIIYNGRDVSAQAIRISDSSREEVEKCKNHPSDKVIINLARINEVKRQNLLAKVVDRLYKEGYTFTVIIVGNKRDERLVNEIESYNCPLVHLLGEKSNPLEYLKLSDAYCLCSSYEGMPISLIEAIGVGIVPICTPVGGIVDVIKDGYNGILAKGLMEDDLYNAIKTFLQLTNSQIDDLRQNVIRSYEPYSMAECARKYEMLFRSC